MRRLWCFAVLVSLLSLCGAVCASSVIVVDMDGSVEDYAALATIARSASLRGRLRLVTVSGVSWGHAPSVARTVCRFLAAFPQLRGVPVAVGGMAAAADRHDAALGLGGCALSQGFPATPRDALLRAMPYSRADVTGAFGTAAALPPVRPPFHLCAARANATEALLDVLAGLAPAGTLSYLALAPLTNFAAALDEAARRGGDRLQHMRLSTQLHIFEKGYCAAADDAAATRVLSEPGLRAALYLPRFYDPAVTFSTGAWAQFSAAARGPRAGPAVAWLRGAWAAKKALLEARDGDPATAFFRERPPASSLAALCALDAALEESCAPYRTPAGAVRLSFAPPPPPPAQKAGESHRIRGNNVTRPLFVTVVPWNGTEGTTPLLHVVATPADTSVEGKKALITVFWSVWLDIFR